MSKSVFVNAFYAIKWQHKLNLCDNIFSEPFLKLILEGGERTLSKPVVKKQPITADILKKVVSIYGRDDDLPRLRICCLMLIGYAGFLRFSELSNIKASNLVLRSSHVEIVVEKSKTDVYRQGNTVVIARTNNSTCPVSMLERYMNAAGIEFGSDEFIFRAISYRKRSNSHVLCKLNKPLSYSRARELLLQTLSKLGLDTKCFGLHSLRSGGVSVAAHNRIPERLLKVHGRWKSDIAKDGYIKENISNRLLVTQNLNI